MTFDKQAFLTMFPPHVTPIDFEIDGVTTRLFVRELNARQVFALQDERRKAEKAGMNEAQRFSIAMISEGLCDEDGKRAFTIEEAQRLLDFRIEAFNKLAAAVGDAIGLGTGKVPAGSPATPSESSSIGSR